jgi:hypothetical protein
VKLHAGAPASDNRFPAASWLTAAPPTVAIRFVLVSYVIAVHNPVPEQVGFPYRSFVNVRL